MKSISHLKRWIKASVVSQIRLSLEGHPFFVEGEDRQTSKERKFIECRVDGPYIRNTGTRFERYAYIEVNLLGTVTRNEENVYDRENQQGLMLAILDRDFCIYRIGNEELEPADDGSLVGTMTRMVTEMLKVSDFGNINPDAEVYQASAESHYEMYFTIED